MDYVCGPVILYSQDKVRMMDFLSDVFEFEVDPEQDLVLNGPLQLKLVELPEDQKENFESRGIKFAFKLKDQRELKEIVNKYNFFVYRKTEFPQYNDVTQESCHLEAGENPQSLTVKDIDGRVWQFDLESMQ